MFSDKLNDNDDDTFLFNGYLLPDFWFRLDTWQSPTLARPAAPLAACVHQHTRTKTKKNWLS